MHRTAEYGIAAHWRYKEIRAAAGKEVEVDEMAWMRQLLDWQREAADPGDFLESLRFDLAAREIFVFTPKGDVVTLPTGSTPVDLAYAVHTEVGHRCIGSRVNGKLVALERELESGDVVEIFTSKAEDAGPSRDWLPFAASPRAKTKIKQWFAKERREEAIEAGKEAITREARRTGDAACSGWSPRTRWPRSPGSCTSRTVSALYAAVGEGHASARHVVQRLVALLGGEEQAEEELAERATPSTVRPRRSTGNAGVVVLAEDGETVGDLYIKLARCCTPVPGDEILGFVTRGGGISVHRTDCTNAGDLTTRAERLVDVAWSVSPESVFLVAIQVEALDRHRLLSDVTKVLADEKVNILSASTTTSQDRVAVSRFSLRDGRPEAPRARAAGGAQRRGRLRRLPGHQRDLIVAQTGRMSAPDLSADSRDPYLWLEDVTGDDALAWVRERNDESLASLTAGDEFASVRDGLRSVLDSDERIPYVRRRGELFYNYWQDADHPKGLWRRTTLDSYRTGDPDWEILIDLDALAAAEDENWVWAGGAVLYPDYERALVQLSRGGADATVVREFDLPTKAFVPDGFVLPEAKHRVSWIDRDTVFVGTDLGPGR